MDIYLPIAELSVNALLLLGLGVAVGAISGIFGVGGGVLLDGLVFSFYQAHPIRDFGGHVFRECYKYRDDFGHLRCV